VTAFIEQQQDRVATKMIKEISARAPAHPHARSAGHPGRKIIMGSGATGGGQHSKTVTTRGTPRSFKMKVQIGISFQI
jgi:hypothetical protein